mmetsp:Transcript_14374/g.22143  ORF Transcript_14374/g.22143 Transcript_14374/m.22143 type:complete len:347 (-) Transcript_14374:130-1170(-)
MTVDSSISSGTSCPQGQENSAQNPNDNDAEQNDERRIYFGYGAMCNPVSRRRRNIQESSLRPAYLPNFKIDFSLAGVANIIPVSEKNNAGVHGVLMEFDSQEMWGKVCQSESGYDKKEELVIPYNSKEKELSNDHNNDKHNKGEKKNETMVQAYVFYMTGTQEISATEEEENKVGAKKKVDVGKPQERYLKVIAEGMRMYDVDENYITKSILGVDCYPSRKPGSYLTFRTTTGGENNLPTMTFEEYEKRACTQIPCFLIGNRVVDLDKKNLPDDDHPLMKLLRAKAIGKSDFTHHLLEVLYDPDLPSDESEHGNWAEDQCVDIFMGSNMYELGQVSYILHDDTTTQ